MVLLAQVPGHCNLEQLPIIVYGSILCRCAQPMNKWVSQVTHQLQRSPHFSWNGAGWLKQQASSYSITARLPLDCTVLTLCWCRALQSNRRQGALCRSRHQSFRRRRCAAESGSSSALLHKRVYKPRLIGLCRISLGSPCAPSKRTAVICEQWLSAFESLRAGEFWTFHPDNVDYGRPGGLVLRVPTD
jgi:hypothetical protein